VLRKASARQKIDLAVVLDARPRGGLRCDRRRWPGPRSAGRADSDREGAGCLSLLSSPRSGGGIACTRRCASGRKETKVFDDYYECEHPLPHLHEKAREPFRRLLKMSRANYMELVVDALVGRLEVAGFQSDVDGRCG
jgi:hypothetical protein